jgi:hypothetical protein
MKRLLLVVILTLTPIAEHEISRKLPLSFYIYEDEGSFHVNGIWFNLEKERRNKIIDSLCDEI